MAVQKVLVLCIDGLEPKIINRLLSQNKLPNFKKLKYYSSLRTTIPPQSPTAWASFITGLSAQEHQLVDFVKRKPKNYGLYLAHSPRDKNLPFQGKPFWEKKKDIKTKVLFLPDTFPAPQNTKTQIISGLGTPDILGTEGSFTLFSQKKSEVELNRGQKIILSQSKKINTFLPGPDFQILTGTKKSNLPLLLEINKNNLKIKLSNQKIILKEKEFSPWIRLSFQKGFKRVWAIAKFYLVSLKPLKLYLSPLQIDPLKPLYLISSPFSFSKNLASKYGSFATLGLPHDAWAYDQNIFSQKAFLSQVNDLFLEREKIILGELKDFSADLFVAYLGTIDTIQHMFWGNREIINHYYQKIDELLG
ncbi:MAG: alkaline phosphatase family protein [Candidatus Shapirobacteria bacterium]